MNLAIAKTSLILRVACLSSIYYRSIRPFLINLGKLAVLSKIKSNFLVIPDEDAAKINQNTDFTPLNRNNCELVVSPTSRFKLVGFSFFYTTTSLQNTCTFCDNHLTVIHLHDTYGVKGVKFQLLDKFRDSFSAKTLDLLFCSVCIKSACITEVLIVSLIVYHWV